MISEENFSSEVREEFVKEIFEECLMKSMENVLKELAKGLRGRFLERDS